ncbi:MAG: Rieske 2Fe-2S domain-containing protein [Bacteroidia bacterium]
MERKEFLIACGKLCIGGVFASTLLNSCMSTRYAVSTLENNILTVSIDEFFENPGRTGRVRKYILLKTEKIVTPICVYRLNDNEYSAVLMLCTHNGCELNPNGDFLVCPCHGSEFSNKGKVQNPPAEIDLKTYTITKDEKNIYIHLA